VGVVGAKLPESKVQYQPIDSDELILAAAITNPIKPKIKLNNLANLPFVMREKGSGTRKSTELLLKEQNFSLQKLNVCATLGSSAAVKEAIKADLGVSILSRLAVQDELDNMKVKQVHIENLKMNRTFYLVTPSRRTLPYKYQQLVNSFLKK
jgi:DNA-binding transcriptional LysR family regulator